MSKTEHSPLPWKIEDGGSPDWLDGIRCQYAIRTDDGNTIAYVFDKPDAEAIINNQQTIDELVDRLDSVMEWIGNWEPNFINDPEWMEEEDVIRAFIAKHKAKP